MALVALPACAFKIDTGNSDIEMRWDNTVKYNLGVRMDKRDNNLGDNWVSQASNWGWDRGDVVTSRVDLLTEFDMVYKKDYGFRVSGAAWNDFAFDEDVKGNPNYQAAGLGTAYPNNKFTSHVKRWYQRSGELLDAFVFGKVDLGSVPLTVRAGRHNVYWGESLFTLGNGIAYGQGPLDVRKATSTPGIEAKELFLPQNQVSAAAQLTKEVSVAANYYLEWDPHRLPEGGTYLGGADLSFLGGTNYLGYQVLGDTDTPKNKGSWGINTQILSETLGGNLGLYYRKFDDRYPTMVNSPTFTYLHNDYARGVKLYGISYSRLIGSMSFSAEVSRREGTALATAGAATGVALGDTWHAVFDVIAYFGKTPLFDSAPLTMELSYSKLAKLDETTKALGRFNGADQAVCTGGIDAGCASKSAWGLNVAFTPTWFQVVPGIDLSMPLVYGVGLKGNSPTPLGTNEKSGAWSAGLGLDIHSKYNVTLAYNDYFGHYTVGPNPLAPVPGISNSVWTGVNGAAIYRDHGWLSLTPKTTF